LGVCPGKAGRRECDVDLTSVSFPGPGLVIDEVVDRGCELLIRARAGSGCPGCRLIGVTFEPAKYRGGTS
jgi:hypothetical protein